ncbi:uncharacterized protein BJ212DRAFT_1479574 [Suillus subaureus]|uniref:Uncharacterized protein n=1 Tax=Suillus subaureus TaxID=48587 RepID=A0A9P7JEV4_9AGAM|nr:uncharacterized protein BJ212DRAFT_1479574 [Suillus subaureus]KAG1818566.1 hypothetical protein BJ212DRAFT_1479574 [Suillus subaureus]
MEQVIGMLGMEIRQPSNPFSNLTFLAICQCQINALKVMIPDLEPPDNPIPNYSIDLGGSYVLLRACARYNYHPGETETQLIHEFLDGPVPKFKCWARLQLPNGQVTRCAWKETLKHTEKVHMAQNVKVTVSPDVMSPASHYNINDDENDRELEYHNDEVYCFITVAMVSVYSCLDPELLQKSMQTVWSCKYHGDEALQLVSVKSIQSVIAMIPHHPKLQSGVVKDHFFLLEKPGLGLVTVDEEIEDEADEDE